MNTFLLICLFLSFIGGEILRFTFFASISFRMLDLVAFIIFISFLVEIFLHPEKRQILFTPTAKWLGGFFLVGVLSLLFNLSHFTLPQIGQASLYLLRYLLYSGIFFYVSTLSNEEKRFNVLSITITGGLLVLFGFIQYVYYNNLRNMYYLGWDDHMYRIFSVFLDPNFTGIVFTLFALFLMGTLWSKRKENKRQLFYLLFILLLVTLIATVMTFSRSALISLGVGSVIFFSLIGRKKYLLIFFSVMIGMLLLATPFFYIENVNLFRAASSEARIESAKNALTIIKGHFLTGVGFNTYRYAQIQYGFRHGVGAEISHADSGTDNSYLFILATMGIVGIIVYLGLLRSLFLSAWEEYRMNKSVYAIVFIASLSAVMVDSIFINSLFYPFVVVWIWMLRGLINYK